jgi:cytochrome c oxidase subunit IV
MAGHIVPKRTYVAVWITLMILTAVTAAVSRIDLRHASAAVALIIATTKALLVILFFMGVKYVSQRMTIVMIVAAFFWLGILLALSMLDYVSRAWR